MLVALLSTTMLIHALGQGSFINLDFELVSIQSNTDINGRVPISEALPGWPAYLDDVPRDWVLYNTSSLGGSSVSLMDRFAPNFSPPPPIQGSYSVYLHAGAGIGQTGQIPNDASSLFFIRQPFLYLPVSFGGQNIPLVQFGTSGINIIMAGDISRFAGQTGELLFAGGGLFDDIQFSNQPIPEPSTFCLFGLGALLLGWRLRKQMKKLLLTCFVAVQTIASVEAQGTFQNLDFESPILPLNGGLQLIANALPGWTGYLGSNQTDIIFYNNISLGAAAITLLGPSPPFPIQPILQGEYTVLLQPSYPGGLVVPSLAQTGMVPGDALSLRMCGGASLVTFNGHQIPLLALGATSTCTIFGGDISAFAGQTGELRFTGGAYLDAIQFSNQPIPEPRAPGLFALGASIMFSCACVARATRLRRFGSKQILPL